MKAHRKGGAKKTAQKYKLCLPSGEELRREMEKERARAEQERALAG